MNRIVLTGFGLWGQEKYNSSWEILKDCQLELPQGWDCDVVQLPVSWSQAPKTLEPLLNTDVKAVICFGMAIGDKILVERMATNLVLPTIPAVDKIPHDSEYVIKGGPPGYWTRLPVNDIISALQQKDIPCAESRWAGDFLCGFIFYWLMHQLATKMPETVGGFVHVPSFSERGMERNKLCSAVPLIVDAVISQLVKLPSNDDN